MIRSHREKLGAGGFSCRVKHRRAADALVNTIKTRFINLDTIECPGARFFFNHDRKTLAACQKMQRINHIIVATLRFFTDLTETVDQFFNSIERSKNQRHTFRCHNQFTVAHAAKHVFSRVGNRFKAWQSEKATGALDRMHNAKNTAEQLGITGPLLKFDQLAIEHLKRLLRFGEELFEEIVHAYIPVGRREDLESDDVKCSFEYWSKPLMIAPLTHPLVIRFSATSFHPAARMPATTLIGLMC